MSILSLTKIDSDLRIISPLNSPGYVGLNLRITKAYYLDGIVKLFCYNVNNGAC